MTCTTASGLLPAGIAARPTIVLNRAASCGRQVDIRRPYLTLDMRPPQFEIPIRYPLSLITLRRRKSRCAERYDGSALGDFSFLLTAPTIERERA